MHLILGITGATGARAAMHLVDQSPWPVALVATPWGRDVCQREGVDFEALAARAERVFDNDNLAAAIASGSVPTVGMVILPCTTSTLGKIATGIADTLLTRAAHCHLKEQRKLILCVRESPWSGIDFENAARISASGGIVMPLSPPYYMFGGRPPETVTMDDLLGEFAARVLALLGHKAASDWESVS